MAKIFEGENEFSDELEEKELSKDKLLNDDITVVNHIIKTSKREKGFNISAVLLLKEKRKQREVNLGEPKILMGDFEYPLKVGFTITLGRRGKIVFYNFYIPYSDILEGDLHTPLYISATNSEGVGYKKHLKYIGFMPTYPSILWSSPIKEFPDEDISVFLRQGSKNFIYSTAPEIKVTTRFGHRLKIALAFILSKLLFFIKTIVLFEKHASEYQASASVMYEKLIDDGYKRVYFILDKKHAENYEIDEKYRKNIVWRFSFKHYLVFFMSRLYLSSESIFHATELRTINRFIHLHVLLAKDRIPYIFLQHGVMYMVRLDAQYRSGFRYGKMFKENSRIVVSSELEADHFIEYGDFPREKLYVTGLAQWDRVEYNSLSEDADRIMIIPTWRPWELTEARSNPKDSGYYKLMNRIVKNIPEEHKESIDLVPHPLFTEYFKDTPLAQYMPDDYENWIKLLDRTKLLITDYSSFSYFAFYKGCNVIFDWSDLDECMENGYEGALMLNEKNVFGDIVYNEGKDLKKLVEENMNSDRKDEYVDRYHRIVKFKDGRNSNRIIKKLKDDGFLN